MLVDDAIARLSAGIEDLGSRVSGAAELTELIRKGALPQTTPYAYVMLAGLTPLGQGEAAAGAFTQLVDEVIFVVLVVRSAGDPTGAKSLAKVHETVWAVVDLLCGWGPDDAIGVLRLGRGQLLSMQAGVVFYQLDFAIRQQVRIVS
jgi:hypothetical protein